jgi:hypothetical protein
MMKNNLNKIIIQRLLSALFGAKLSHTSRYLSFFEKLRSKNGLPYAIAYFKNSKLLITRYMCGRPLLTNKFFISTKGGFPTSFLYLKDLVDSKEPNNLKIVLTLLNYTRAVKPTKEEDSKILPKFNTITDPYKGKNDYSIPYEFIKSFVRKYDLGLEIPKYSQEMHYISCKSSPFGPSSLSATYSLFSMANLHHNMLNNFIRCIGQDSYMKVFGNLIKDM